MPRGGGRGNKKSHKGQRRHFTSEDELKVQADREEKQKEWRRMKGIESEEEEDEKDEKDGAKADKTKNDDDVQFAESSESESESDDEGKAKGVQHLIQVENPNHIQKKTKKVQNITLESDDSKPVLTRREREELEKQQARAHYQKLHLAGKTEEARADMARLALIRKNREEAAKKRDEEKKAADEKKKVAESRLLEKKALHQQKK